jgi:hypothetical protein
MGLCLHACTKTETKSGVADLLKGVAREVLEAEDVKDANLGDPALAYARVHVRPAARAKQRVDLATQGDVRRKAKTKRKQRRWRGKEK